MRHGGALNCEYDSPAALQERIHSIVAYTQRLSPPARLTAWRPLTIMTRMRAPSAWLANEPEGRMRDQERLLPSVAPARAHCRQV